ncbi:MAG: gamma-glutamylcyclotransferase family protein [Caldilineaceae bacterium]
MHETQLPLFVYGTLMCGERAFGYLAKASVHWSPARLPKAALYDLGAYPMAVAGKGTVVGELHWLQSEGYAALLQRLDRYEGREYWRVIRPVLLPDDVTAQAWVYLGEPAYVAKHKLLADGDWRKR